ncbi:amidase [Pseudomonas sp. LRF_L74]|uniref:amidase n=1 Tax=Pseudomonas sp. LRF_L74 TaxID=3369422 RepID=UPI003F609A2D
MNASEYASYDGLGLAELVSRGEVSRQELATLALGAIETMNPYVNAVIETYPGAIASAERTTPSGHFDGVPFLLKDIGSHDADVTFELGSRLTRGLKSPPQASELVNRFRQAGVTILGRTNVPEMGSSCTTEPLLHGPTRNPWNLERSAGGSSGGAAAAVAAGMVPIAHANDAGGSIRWPASCCGLFGLKPSRNLNPVGPDTALALNGLAAEHIVSRSVRDSAAMLDHTAGPDIGSWCHTPRLEGSYLEALRQPLKPLRIGINLDPVFPPTTVQREIVDTLRDTGLLCETLGHHVEEARFSFDHETLLKAFAIIWSSNLRSGIELFSEITGNAVDEEHLEPHVLAAYRDAGQVSASKLVWALEQMNIASRAYGAFFQCYDVMLTPTGAMEPFEIGKIGKIPAPNFYDWFIAMCSHCPFLSTANIAGIPAMSVPLHWSVSGLPIGSHFLARMGAEPLLLQLAAQLETAQPWAQRVAPQHISRYR